MSRLEAKERCDAMDDARLANLPLDAYSFVAKKTLHYATSRFWWTAVTYGKQWSWEERTPNGSIEFFEHFDEVAYWPHKESDVWPWTRVTQRREYRFLNCIAVNFAAPPYYFAYDCSTELGYICEKNYIVDFPLVIPYSPYA